MSNSQSLSSKQRRGKSSSVRLNRKGSKNRSDSDISEFESIRDASWEDRRRRLSSTPSPASRERVSPDALKGAETPRKLSLAFLVDGLKSTLPGRAFLPSSSPHEKATTTTPSLTGIATADALTQILSKNKSTTNHTKSQHAAVHFKLDHPQREESVFVRRKTRSSWEREWIILRKHKIYFFTAVQDPNSSRTVSDASPTTPPLTDSKDSSPQTLEHAEQTHSTPKERKRPRWKKGDEFRRDVNILREDTQWEKLEKTSKNWDYVLKMNCARGEYFLGFQKKEKMEALYEQIMENRRSYLYKK